MGDIVISTGNEVQTVCGSEIINTEMAKVVKQNRNHLMVTLNEMISGIQNVKEILDPTKTYIAKFPRDILDKINSGQYDIMKSKQGDILSTIIDKNLPGNRNIVHQLRLEEVAHNLEDKIKGLSGNISNIALQQQIADLSKMISKIQYLAIDIKRGQQNDRFGLINSSIELIEQALCLEESNPNKSVLLNNAIHGLSDGRSQIALYLKDEIAKDCKIPKNKFGLFFRCLFNEDYLSDIEKQFADFQEGMQYYLKATSVMATAYQLQDSPEAISKVYEPAKALIATSCEKIQLLSTLATRGEISKGDLWYMQADVYIGQIEKNAKPLLSDEIAYIDIEFKVEELMEVSNE